MHSRFEIRITVKQTKTVIRLEILEYPRKHIYQYLLLGYSQYLVTNNTKN